MRTFCICALETAVALLATLFIHSSLIRFTTFYAGKTVSIVKSSGPGGGYDIYARLIARHLGKHIPGSSNIIVHCMPGAGGRRDRPLSSLRSGPFDGTVIGSFEQGIALDQATGGSEIRFDAEKFYWLGSPYDTVGVVMTWGASKTKSLNDAVLVKRSWGALGRRPAPTTFRPS